MIKNLFHRFRGILQRIIKKITATFQKINWESIDDGLMRLFQISWRLGVGLIVLFLALFIYRGLNDDNFAIKAFLVPKQLNDAGYSGMVVANRLFDEVQEIEEFVASQKEELLNIQSEIKPDLNLDVMGFGLSVNSTIYYLKDLMGKENRFISGELTDLGAQLSLTLRLTGHPNQVITVNYEEAEKQQALDSLIHESAKRMLGILDPYRLAVYHYKKGDDDLSLEIVREIIKGKPEESAWGYLAWGNLLKKQRQSAKACEKYSKAIEIQPDFLLAWANWAWAKLSMGDYEAAIPIFEKAASLNPENSSYYNGLAICYRNLKDFDKAEACYEKAIKIQPDVIWWYGNYASFKYAVRQDTAGAAAIMVRARANIPESDEFYLSQTAYYFYHNKLDSALIMVQKALELNPENISALDQFSRTLFNTKKDYKGSKTVMLERIKIIEANPGVFEEETYKLQSSYNFLAMAEYEMEEYDSALTHINKAIAFHPDVDYPYSTLAETYGLMGDKEGFFQAVELAMDRGFDFRPYLNEKPYNQFANDQRFLNLINRMDNGTD